MELPEAIKIFNNNFCSSTKYTPNFLFNYKDEFIVNKVIDNLKNS